MKMKHYLIYQDDKSDKFWQIEVAEKSFTVTYGKTGTAGTAQTKTFDTEEKWLKEAEKLLNEQLKKGYKESSSKSVGKDYQNEWKSICNAADWRTATINHFRYLADSGGYEALLITIMDAATGVSIEDNSLIVSFPEERIRCSAPVLNISKEFPKSFKDLIQKHEVVSVESAMIALGDHGMFDSNWLEEFESELLEIIDPEKVISPLWDYSDCWVYHPKEKNTQSEPVIYFLSHEGGDINNPQECNAGSLFLTRLARELNINYEPPVKEGLSSSTITLEEHTTEVFTKLVNRTRLNDGRILVFRGHSSYLFVP